MEVFGLLAFVMIMCYSSYPNKVKRLEKTIALLKQGKKKEISEMSRIIESLIGKKCRIERDFEIQSPVAVVILEVDECWVKFERVGKHNEKFIEIIRIDDIKKIDCISE